MTPPDERITALAKRIDPPAWVDLPAPELTPLPDREFKAPTWWERLLGWDHGEETEMSCATRQAFISAQLSRAQQWRAEWEAQRDRREKAMDAARIAIAVIEAQDMKQEGVDVHL